MKVKWEEHVDALDEAWEPGEHASVIAPTGEGKSWIMRHLLELWTQDRVLLIDVKGDDELWTRGDFMTVSEFPTWWQQDRAKRRGRQWYRLVLPPPTERQKARQVVHQALNHAYKAGNWVIVIDETRAITDTRPPALALNGHLDAIWLRGRSRRITLIAATQAPRWVPSSFYDQPRRLWIGYVGDGRARDRLDEIGGDTRQLVEEVNHLQEHEFVYATRRQMYIVKAPPWLPMTEEEMRQAASS